MADKIIIDIFRKKPLDELSEILSHANSKLDTGSSSAAVATLASSLLLRGAETLQDKGISGDRLDYILRNADKLREYMFYLIDEDVKCRGPVKRAVSEGNPDHIEACLQPATAICSEIVSMMTNLMNLAEELCELGGDELPHHIFEAAEYAMSSIKASVSYILSMLSFSSDDTFIYVTRRENEIMYSEAEAVYRRILGRFKLPF